MSESAMVKIIRKRPPFDEESLSLEEWLSHVLVPKYKRSFDIADYQFPTDHHRNEFLETIGTRSEDVIRALLRSFLIKGGGLGVDVSIERSIRSMEPAEQAKLVEEYEFVRRLMEPPFEPWHGITWILDLLPDYPGRALDVLSSYITAHSQFLPDWRFNGLADAEAVIRHRYVHRENPREVLLSLRPDEFEYLVAAVYRRLGYRVIVTQKSCDGGVDIEARRDDAGGRALLLIQCKRYQDVVRVQTVRELMGVVSRRQANKGVVVATCGFTRSARSEAAANSIIELINFQDLNRLLNLHIGAKWPDYVYREIRTVQLENSERLAYT
jgi:restriction system protein